MRSTLLMLSLVLAGCPKPKPVEPASEPVQPTLIGTPTEPEAVSTEPPAEAPMQVQGGTELDQAIALLTTGKETDALRARDLLEALAKKDDTDPYLHLNLGVAYQTLGDFESAASSFGRATRLDDKNPKGWLYLGVAELALGDTDAALRRFRKGMDRSPEDIELRVALASAQRVSGDLDGAIETAKAGLKINSRSLPLYDVIGLAYLDKGEHQRARFVYEKAETLPGSESSAGIQANFGWTLYHLGERYRAELKLREAVALDPGHVPALVQLSRIYMTDHNWADAIPLLEGARTKDPANHGVLMNLGTAYRGAGRTDDARNAWEQALELSPSDPSPQFNLAILYGDDLKDYGAAVSRFQTYIDEGGEQSELAATYIEAVEKEKKRAERRRKREEDRKRREAERAEEQRILDSQDDGTPATPEEAAPSDDSVSPEGEELP